jgi:energy-coupling factor transporter ATP-binding protein EcfA2
MLDEPTNGLDIASSRAVRNVIHEIRDQRRCVLFSSHIMSEVEALCDRITVICDGLIVANGALEELRRVHRPAQPGRGFFGGGHPGCDSYMHNVWTVFQKERVDNLRDWRSIILALIYPIICTLLLGLLISFVGGSFRGQS